MTEGLKYDDEKLLLELVPAEWTIALAHVMTYGAKKYAPENWRKVEPKERYLAAALRHIAAVRTGQSVDTESGMPHIWHAVTSLMMYATKSGDADFLGLERVER